MGGDYDVTWLERASQVDPFGPRLRVSAIASKLPSRVALQRTASFLIDATTPHGDVLINENRAIKPATGWVTVHATEPISSGTHEWSIKIENQGETSDGSGLMLGVAPRSFCRYDSFISQGGGWCLSRAGKFYGQWKRVEGVGSSTPLVFGTGDTVVFELDTETARLTVTVGDRFVVGEIAKLTPEVFPAASLHYRQQHIYFDTRRLKQRQTTETGWFQKSLHHSCDIICHLTRDHLSTRIDQLIGRGVESTTEAIGTSKWESFYSLREEVVQSVCSGVGSLTTATRTPSAYHARHLKERRTRLSVEERVIECGLELCLSLLGAVSGTPGVSDAVFEMLSVQLEKQPLFSLAADGPGSPLIPLESLDKLSLAARTSLTPPALRLLVILAVLRGEATEALRTICALMEAPQASLNVGRFVTRLSQSPAEYNLPILRFGDDTERIEVRQTTRRTPASIWGTDEKTDKWIVHSIASDGDSLYLATADGLIRMGCGKRSVPNEVTARNSEDFKGQPVSVALLGGLLYCRPSHAFHAAYNAAQEERANTDILVVSPETLKVIGYISADGEGSIPTEDNRHTPLPMEEAQEGRRALESKLITDGTFLYIISGVPHAIPKDESGVPYPPTCPGQCRSAEEPIHVTVFDPSKNFRCLQTIVLSGPRPSAVAKAQSSGRRKSLHLCKDTYIDFGPVAEQLCSASGHITIEMWLIPGAPDESKNVYVHGDKSCGGEIFIDIHSVDNGWYIKGGARVDVRNGVRSCGAVASLPAKVWVHVALVFDGVWSILINGSVAGVSRSEDTPVVVTRPTKRWIAAASYSGGIAELRIWRGARPAAVIQRDLHSSLQGNETGLLAYWPLDEGEGRAVYDWAHNAQRLNGWISHKPKPIWKDANDLPVAQTEFDEDETPTVSPWSVFLPSVERSAMCTNGRELMVLVPDIEDAGAGQKHGLAMYFSLEDGTLLARSELVAPPVDSACHFDCLHNGVWYSSTTFQVLCWTPAPCSVPTPVMPSSEDYAVGQTITSEYAVEKLAQALNDRASKYMTYEWAVSFQILSIDPCAELFALLQKLITVCIKQRNESTLLLSCLRVLRANFRVLRKTGVDPTVYNLQHDGTANTGRCLYELLLELMEEKGSREGREASEALAEGLQLFFRPAKEMLTFICDLLSKASLACSPIIEVVCLHVAEFQQAMEVLLSFGDDTKGIESFLKLLTQASFSELQSVKENGIIPGKPSSISSAIVSFQTAILGRISRQKARPEAQELYIKIIELHAELLTHVCRMVKEADKGADKAFGISLLQWSAPARALGFAAISLPLFSGFESRKRALSLLRDITEQLESVCQLDCIRDQIISVEQSWDANWESPSTPDQNPSSDESLGAEDQPHWLFTFKLCMGYVAARIAGQMIDFEGKSGGKKQTTTGDEAIAGWVSSSLFSGGLRETPSEASPSPRLRLCDEIVQNTGDGAALWAHLKSTSTTASGGQIFRRSSTTSDEGGTASPPSTPAVANEIENTMRHIYAVLVRDSRCDFPEAQGKPICPESIPQGLKWRFQKVEMLIGWLMHIRHERELPATSTFDIPPPIMDMEFIVEAEDGTALLQITEMCKFVLKFHHAPSPLENKVVLKALLSASKRKSKVLPPNSWRSMFYGWRAIKKMQRLLVLNSKEDEDTGLDLLLKYFSARVQEKEIEAEVQLRQQQGALRAEGLEYLTQSLESGSCATRLESLRVAAKVLAAFHYTSGIQGAGPTVSSIVQEGVYTLLKIAVAPLASSLPPTDSISQVQCNLVLRMLNCRWDVMDFAFLRSINLPVLLFNIVSKWGKDGEERIEDNGNETTVRVAASLFNACALQSAMALQNNVHPGLMKATSRFLAQTLECISHDLKHSIEVLREPTTDTSRVETHVAHIQYLLTVLAGVLQAVSNGVYEGLNLVEYLPLLTACVFLPAHFAKISKHAMTNIRVLLQHLSIEQADQGLADIDLPEAADFPKTALPVGKGKASLETTGGAKVIRLLVEIAAGTLTTPNAGADEEVQGGYHVMSAGDEAQALLQQLFLKNRTWQAFVGAWVKSVLASPPSFALGLNDKKVKIFILAINVVAGSATSLRAGVEAEHLPMPPATKSNVVVVDVNGPTATIVGADLGLSSPETEVSINTLRTTPAPHLDGTTFSDILDMASNLLFSLAPDTISSTQFFPEILGQCLTTSYVLSKVLRCLALYMSIPACAVSLVGKMRGDSDGRVLQILAFLSREPQREAGTADEMEAKSLYLHSLLAGKDKAAEEELAVPVHRPTMQRAVPPVVSLPTVESAEKKARKAAAEDLSHILHGFSVPLCTKALEMTRDDSDKAAALLMDNTDSIAAAVQMDLVVEERRAQDVSSLPACETLTPTPLKHCISFGPTATGSLSIPLSRKPEAGYTLECFIKIEGKGLFNRTSLHPDAPPILPLRVLSTGSLEVVVNETSLVVSCHGFEGSIPVRAGWVHLVVVSGEYSEVWCDKTPVFRVEGSMGEGEEVTLGPGLAEAVTEMHPCVSIAFSLVRMWDVQLPSGVAQALSDEVTFAEFPRPMHTENVVFCFSMKEGCGDTLHCDASESTAILSKGFRWECIGLPKMVPEVGAAKLVWETEDALRAVILTEEAPEPDIPRTEWIAAFSATSSLGKIAQEVCSVDTTLCVLHARQALSSLSDVLLGSEQSKLWDVDSKHFFDNVAESALHLPSTLASFAKLSTTGLADGAISSIQTTVKSWAATQPDAESVSAFVSGCLGLMESGPDRYIYETPTHPYSPTDVILRTINVPGTSSYTLDFDARCKTLDYLYLYGDRTQKSQISKFPDAQGNWTSLNVEKSPAFCIRFTGDCSAPSYWGYLFTVSAKTPRLELACEMLHTLLGCDKVIDKQAFCTSTTVAHLIAVAHREVGRRRELPLELLAVLLGKHAASFAATALPDLKPMLRALQSTSYAQLKQERSNVSGIPPSCAKGLSRQIQTLAEVAVSCEISSQIFERKNPYNLPDPTLQEAKQRCYLTPSIRPSLQNAPPSLNTALHCVCETTVRGKSLVFSEGVWRTVQGSSGVTLGKWYFEVRLMSPEPVYIGWACEQIDTACGECQNSWAFCGNRGYRYHGGDRALYPADTDKATKWKGCDVVGCYIDLYAREISYAINGRPLGPAFTALPNIAFFPTITVGSSSVDVNFGDTPFSYLPGPDYLPFSYANVLPGMPVQRFMAFLSTSEAMLHGKPLPIFFNGMEKDNMPNRLTREGVDVVEMVALDGRPKIDNMTHIKSLATACTARASCKISRSGKWYYEATMVSDGLVQLGWVTEAFQPDPVRAKGVGDDAKSWAYDGCRLLLRHRKEHHQAGSRTWREGDIVGCLLDLDAMSMRFTLNGGPITRSQSCEAFTGLSVNEWYYPAVSMDPDNSVAFNFGAEPFIYLPHGYKGMGVKWPILQQIDGWNVADSSALPDTWPYKSVFTQDVAIVSLVNSLCDASRQNIFNLRLKELLNASSLRSFGLQGVAFEQLYTRVVILRHFNQIFRAIYPFLDLTETVRPKGMLAEAALRMKSLLLSTTTSTLLQAHVFLTNSLVEPQQPKVILNRRLKQQGQIESTLFGQLHSLLSGKPQSMFFSSKRFWSVSFQGEGAEDVGGPYRECLAELCSELMTPEIIPLFRPSPNSKNNIGSHRDRMVLNTKPTQLLRSLSRFLGKLMAACMRTCEPLPLYISPLIWKALSGDTVSATDLESVDKSVMSSLLCLLRLDEEGVTEETFGSVFDGNFTTENSTGEEEELLPGGAGVGITWANRDLYVKLAIQKRLAESDDLVQELLNGFHSVLPKHFAHLFDACELERLVCGSPVWDVQELKTQSRYEGISPDDTRCKYLWEVLGGFTTRERCLFLRFVSGRERAPVKLKIMPLLVDKPDEFLPVASTCFFWISLPNYSSAEILKQKLLYAINNCTDIDTDYRVRGSVDESAPPALGTGDPGDEDDFEDYTHLL